MKTNNSKPQNVMLPQGIIKQLDNLKEWNGEPRFRVIERLLKTRMEQLK